MFKETNIFENKLFNHMQVYLNIYQYLQKGTPLSTQNPPQYHFEMLMVLSLL